MMRALDDSNRPTRLESASGMIGEMVALWKAVDVKAVAERTWLRGPTTTRRRLSAARWNGRGYAEESTLSCSERRSKEQEKRA